MIRLLVTTYVRLKHLVLMDVPLAVHGYVRYITWRVRWSRMTPAQREAATNEALAKAMLFIARWEIEEEAAAQTEGQ